MDIGITYNSFANKKMLPEEKELKATSFAIGKHLLKLGYHVQYFDMDNPDDIKALYNSKIDVAFDTCERIHDDPRGEAYTAALLEYLDIPHTRTGAFQIALGVNKVRVKLLLSYNDIPIPHFQVFPTEEEELCPDLEFPLFVKGIACENSIGIDEHSLVSNLHELKEQVRKINISFKQPALVEEFIGGREFSVAVLPGKTNCLLPIMEIEFDDLPPHKRYLDYKAKWVTHSDQYKRTVPVYPVNLTITEQKMISETALKCFNILGLDSYARIDMRYKDHTPYVLEVNQNPSINETGSGYVHSCENHGLNYTEMVEALLENALDGYK
jgi:D-alanine-D-alanine ligase